MTQVTGLELRLPSPLEEVHDERLAARGVRLLLKRDDLINPDIPGNKWRKLKYNLEDAKASGARTLLTFGGAYSNHIRAVAAAGHYFGFADRRHHPRRGAPAAQPDPRLRRPARHDDRLPRPHDLPRQDIARGDRRPAPQVRRLLPHPRGREQRRGRARRRRDRRRADGRLRRRLLPLRDRRHAGRPRRRSARRASARSASPRSRAPDSSTTTSGASRPSTGTRPTTGRSNSTTTSAASRVVRARWTSSSTSSAAASRWSWNGSMSPRCCTASLRWWMRRRFEPGMTVVAVITGPALN